MTQRIHPDVSALAQHEQDLCNQFKSEVSAQLDALDALGDVETIVGIPYRYHADQLQGAIEAARSGLMQMGLGGKSAVVHVGPSAAADVITGVEDRLDRKTPVPVLGISLGSGLDARAWRVLALLEVAERLRSSLLLISAHLFRETEDTDAERFSARWIIKLLTPVLAHGQDLAIARFNDHPLTHPVESHLVYPVIAGVFGWHLPQVTSRGVAISHRLVRWYRSSGQTWPFSAGDYGVGAWLALRAIQREMLVCEVPLGSAPPPYETGNIKRAFRQAATTLMREVVSAQASWRDRPAPIRTPAVVGPRGRSPTRPCAQQPDALRRRLRLESNYFEHTLYPDILPDALRVRMDRSMHPGEPPFSLSDAEWVDVLREFLLAYGFDRGFHGDDIVAGLFSLFLARTATFLEQAQHLTETLTDTSASGQDPPHAIACHEVERALRDQADRFVGAWPEFRKDWRDRESRTAPYLPRLGAWEFVPHVGVILPQALRGPGGQSVSAPEVYKSIIDRYRAEYTRFAATFLGVSDPTDSHSVLERLEGFMGKLEESVAANTPPNDITTVEGTRNALRFVCSEFAQEDCFHLTDRAAHRVLQHAPPNGLIVRWGYRNVHELLEQIEPRHAMGLAAYTDQLPYLYRVQDIIERQATPDWFESSPLSRHVFDAARTAGAVEPVGTVSLLRLAGCVVVSNMPDGTGGAYPRLWFLLRTIKGIVSAEFVSRIWRGFSGEKGRFGALLAATIREHWGRRVMSAHNAFENRHHRTLVERVKKFVDALEPSDVSRQLRAAAEVYHLSITLPDATFVPLSAWTWASYSARGGIGVPTPLSAVVERDWSTYEFVSSYLERAGIGNGAAVDDNTMELVAQGREPEDLRKTMLGVSADVSEIVVPEAPRAETAAARKLTRPRDDAMLAPTTQAWESRYVLNAAALRVDGTVYILYRAYGDDEVSRIGLAWSRDGVNVDGRMSEPIFSPTSGSEDAGCEDPRTVVIDGRVYMLYTAWDGILPQIAMASISVEAFLDRRFDQWKRHGLAFPGLENKDAVIYPEPINGRYAVYHRLDPNMWGSYIDKLTCPWPRSGQKIIAGPRAGMMWDGVKIGAGAPPLKTTHGWLNIYHGVDYERSYRLGALLMPIEDPSTVIYRTPNPILEPETDYEVGDTGSWVPHVVFTCGAVPASDRDVIGPDDEILVYYGAADTVISVATGRLRDIVPDIAARTSAPGLPL